MFFDLKSLAEKYSIRTDHIIHVGAHKGQELSLYAKVNPKEIWLFEPQKDIFKVLVEECKPYKWAKCHNLALGSQAGVSKIYKSKTNSGESSSLLAPHLHLQHFPTVLFEGQEDVQVETLDNLLQKDFEPTILCMDTQGYELQILKGSTNTLKTINLIITEFSTKEFYKGCPLLSDMDSFLNQIGFSRKEIHWQDNSWGDAAYIRVND